MIKRSLAVFFFFFFVLNAAKADQLIIEPDMGRAPIVSLLKNAKNSIQLVMYGFTDPALQHAMIEAKQQGKNVKILIEPNPYKAEGENDSAMHQLKAAHIEILTPNPDMKLTHEKTLLTDQNNALIMTFNFTRSTFSKERNFALLITDPAEIQEISRVFYADAQHKNIAANQSNLVWSPNNSREKLLDFIKQAHSEIKIYAQDISDYQFIGALAKAARTGKSIKIILSQLKQDFPNRKLDYLRRAGVEIRFSKNYLIHAKVIISDKERALLGSINFTRASINDNRELSVITQDRESVASLLKTFNDDWKDSIS